VTTAAGATITGDLAGSAIALLHRSIGLRFHRKI
jgi:hypothetical protein